MVEAKHKQTAFLQQLHIKVESKRAKQKQGCFKCVGLHLQRYVGDKQKATTAKAERMENVEIPAQM